VFNALPLVRRPNPHRGLIHAAIPDTSEDDMMHGVTVQSSTCGEVVQVPFASEDNLGLAQQIAAAISSEIANGSARTALSRNGPPPPVRGRDTGVFFQDTDGITCLPKGYDAVVNTASHATIFGSGGSDETILSGNGSLTFVATTGSGSVVAGGGNNDIEISCRDRGAWLIATGGGSDTIVAAGNGGDTIRPGAGRNLVILGDGNDLLQLTGQDTVTGSGGHDTVDANGAKSSMIFGGSSNILFLGGAGSATIQGGCGSDTVYGGSGRLSVQGGTEGHNRLYAGTGAATLFGGGTGDQLYAQGNQAQVLFACAGNETLSAALSTGNVSLVGGSGKDQLIGGGGRDTFVGGSGNATMEGGSGKDVFAFVNGSAGGKDLILNFGNADKIELSGYGPHAVACAVASQTVSHESVSITLMDDTRITFAGVASLKSSNFL
jgi:Ca2+-binding RTX toxin-like protein